MIGLLGALGGLLAGLVVLVGLGAGPAAEAELVERVLAVVDEDPILLSEVDRALALGLVVLLFRRRRTLDAGAWSGMSG